MDKYEIDRPIFFIGAARSGTTILQRIIAGHKDLAWISIYTGKLFIAPRLAFLSNYYPFFIRLNLPKYLAKLIPRPVEGHIIFQKPDLAEVNSVKIKKTIFAHLKYQNKTRFFNKNIRNYMILPWLEMHFPGAIFVHIVREPESVIASQLNFNEQRHHKVWKKGKYDSKNWGSSVKPMIQQRITLWNQDNLAAHKFGESIKGRYLRINYEGFVKDPKGTLGRILDHCELENYPEFWSFFDLFEVSNMNGRHFYQFKPEQLAWIEEETREIATLLYKE